MKRDVVEIVEKINSFKDSYFCMSHIFFSLFQFQPLTGMM